MCSNFLTTDPLKIIFLTWFPFQATQIYRLWWVLTGPIYRLWWVSAGLIYWLWRVSKIEKVYDFGKYRKWTNLTILVSFEATKIYWILWDLKLTDFGEFLEKFTDFNKFLSLDNLTHFGKFQIDQIHFFFSYIYGRECTKY